MADVIEPPTNSTRTAVYRRPAVARLLIIALFAEIAYATLNLSTMPIYLAAPPSDVPGLIPNGRGFGETVIGLVVTAFLFAEAVFKGPMGHFADKFGPKRLMVAGPAISFVTTLTTIFLPPLGGGTLEVMVFVVLRAFDGLGAAMLWPAAFSAVNEAVPDDEREQGMSLLNLCYILGIALAFPLGGIANDLTNTRWAGLALAAVLFLAATISVWRFVPEFRAEGHETSEHGFQDFLKSISQIPVYLMLAIVTFIGVGFPMTIFKLFPIQQFGYSESQVGLLILPGALILAGASVPMSRFAERLGRARAVHVGIGLCAAGMIVIGSGALIPAMRQSWLLVVGAIPVGIGFLMAIPAWMASVSDIDPQRRGTNIGAIMTAQGLGAIIGAPLGAAFYEKFQHVGLGVDFGRYSPFLACAVFLTAGWLLSLKTLRP